MDFLLSGEQPALVLGGFTEVDGFPGMHTF